MKGICRHELSSYFSNLLGYVFGAFLLLFAGIYTMILNLKGQLANFEYVFGNLSFVFLVIVPVITMRVFSEERRQKTDQLLYSLPVSMTQIVLGKFAAMLIILAIPVGIICIYPLILSAFGNVHMPAAFTAALGFFMLGAALLSIGMFISSLTANQAVAAGCSFAVLLLNYYLNKFVGFLPSSPVSSVAILSVGIILLGFLIQKLTKSGFIALLTGLLLETVLLLTFLIWPEWFYALIAQIAGGLCLFERFYVFAYGVLDLSGLVYFLSVTAFFLFLSVQSLEKRRWSE